MHDQKSFIEKSKSMFALSCAAFKTAERGYGNTRIVCARLFAQTSADQSYLTRDGRKGIRRHDRRKPAWTSLRWLMNALSKGESSADDAILAGHEWPDGGRRVRTLSLLQSKNELRTVAGISEKSFFAVSGMHSKVNTVLKTGMRVTSKAQHDTVIHLPNGVDLSLPSSKFSVSTPGRGSRPRAVIPSLEKIER